MLSVVYGRNNRRDREQLWKDMIAFARNCVGNKPWILLGNFNVCKEINEKLDGSRLHPRDLNDFVTCLDDCGIEDIKATGALYTWSNRHEGIERIMCKLDRSLVNLQWCNTFNDVEGYFPPPGVSDHSPIILKWLSTDDKAQPPFRFFNHWVDHAEFRDIVLEAWNCEGTDNPMIRLYTKLKLIKGKLKIWSRKNFSDLQEKVNKAKKVLDRVQMAIQANPLDTQLASMENTALKEYNAATKEEAASAKQKAGATWALLGDDNIEFFDKCIKGNRSRNSILRLEGHNNQVLTNKKDITTEQASTTGPEGSDVSTSHK
ncbi:Exo_endo_phos domain-containing protein [Thalictrum thalictroides]|uniref:Exo_endo_phos domain-containing protein n=1 Tax=Thalictrum thalictroides TaxID=46969 RepID=A0A7J6WVS3_THATH|nr:Exo_endo_phos domain-containing protein [Thalictrum thalictroides]